MSNQQWNLTASEFTKRCHNPIRSIIEGMNLKPNPDKPMIALSVGDPTIFGNLKTDRVAVDAVIESIESYNYNGYAPSTGYEEAKQAIAQHVSTPGDEFPVQSKDVIICSGCSHSLEMCITVLADCGQNILIPKPGFPIYKMIADCLQVECREYNLLPEKNWEVDLDHLESLIDGKTAAIIVNSPSNPCGAVYTKAHLEQILGVAAKHHLPIISDEVYDYFVFKGHEYHSLGSLSKDVPILACGGLTKRFLVPGWRLGWIIVHDRHNAFSAEIYKGLLGLSQRIMGSNTLVQGALPTILTKTPASFLENTIAAVEDNAKMVFDMLSSAPGLRPMMPAGAMYMMVGMDMDKFPEFKDDLKMAEKMVAEQSVFCLPGAIFGIPGYVRLVLTVPAVQMKEACLRMIEFSKAHYRSTEKVTEVTSTMEQMKIMGITTTLVSLKQPLGRMDSGHLVHPAIARMDSERRKQPLGRVDSGIFRKQPLGRVDSGLLRKHQPLGRVDSAHLQGIPVEGDEHRDI